MYTTYISTDTQFLLFIGKLQGGPNSYPLLVHPVYLKLFLNGKLFTLKRSQNIA